MVLALKQILKENCFSPVPCSWELMQITQGRADAPRTLLIFDLKLDID